MDTARQPSHLGRPLGISAALHLSVVVLALIAFRKRPAEPLPPIYKVDIVAAPRGERAIGEVKPEEAPAVTPPAAKPRPKTAAPRAGGGPEGGTGTDVATVHTEGIEFPFPGYLNNIVRQIALNFKPSDTNSALRAEVMFLIYRNGSVKITRFVTRSGSYSFDLEAQGAIESAAPNFGPLPDGFRDDVLPVVFSFDPRFLR